MDLKRIWRQFAIVIFASVSCAINAQAQSRDISGTWEGAHVCRQGTISAKLYVKKIQSGRFEAKFGYPVYLADYRHGSFIIEASKGEYLIQTNAKNNLSKYIGSGVGKLTLPSGEGSTAFRINVKGHGCAGFTLFEHRNSDFFGFKDRNDFCYLAVDKWTDKLNIYRAKKVKETLGRLGVDYDVGTYAVQTLMNSKAIENTFGFDPSLNSSRKKLKLLASNVMRCAIYSSSRTSRGIFDYIFPKFDTVAKVTKYMETFDETNIDFAQYFNNREQIDEAAFQFERYLDDTVSQSRTKRGKNEVKSFVLNRIKGWEGKFEYVPVESVLKRLGNLLDAIE